MPSPVGRPSRACPSSRRTSRQWVSHMRRQPSVPGETGLPTKPTLPIHDMEQRHTGLTKAIADSYTEAASVCLDRHHEPPADFEIETRGSRTTATVEWGPPSARTRRAWANETDATEAGACACALAAVELMHGLVTVHRAETLTGADYYVARPGASPDDLEDCQRLEVSGVDRGFRGVLETRLRAKLEQAAAGRSNLPAMASVVGFRASLVMLAELRSDGGGRVQDVLG